MSGTDPARGAAAGAGNNVGADVAASRAEGPASGPFSRAIVHEVFGDLAYRERPELLRIADNLPAGGSEALQRAPRNSILVRVVAGAGGAASAGNVLCYPFFPSHISMPVKPGEQVWIMNESPGGTNPHAYWICRVTEPDHADDVNFTHPERRHNLYIDKVRGQELPDSQGDTDGGEETKPFDGLTGPDNNPGPPAFADKPPDGPAEGAVVNDEAEVQPVPEEAPEAEEPSVYQQIYTGSFAMQSVTMEPVPRFTKRPGDLVFQGSNNALICLGQDRGWTHANRPDGREYSNAFSLLNSKGEAATPPPEMAGTVDIVAGRGRYYEASPADPDLPPRDTQARTIKNARDKLETDKNPASYTRDQLRKKIAWNRFDVPYEGDPDFLVDCSRIYVSMKTSADKNFNIEQSTINPVFEGALEDKADSPFIVMKSDEIRIVARKDPDRDEINGSIRLIKEGDVNGDQATIYMLPDGIVEISGSKIYLGQSGQGHGPGTASSQPYVRYSDLQALLTEAFTNIKHFAENSKNHSTPGYGAPSLELVGTCQKLGEDMQKRIDQIPSIQSTRIFGE